MDDCQRWIVRFVFITYIFLFINQLTLASCPIDPFFFLDYRLRTHSDFAIKYNSIDHQVRSVLDSAFSRSDNPFLKYLSHMSPGEIMKALKTAHDSIQDPHSGIYLQLLSKTLLTAAFRFTHADTYATVIFRPTQQTRDVRVHSAMSSLKALGLDFIQISEMQLEGENKYVLIKYVGIIDGAWKMPEDLRERVTQAINHINDYNLRIETFILEPQEIYIDRRPHAKPITLKDLMKLNDPVSKIPVKYLYLFDPQDLRRGVATDIGKVDFKISRYSLDGVDYFKFSPTYVQDALNQLKEYLRLNLHLNFLVKRMTAHLQP